MAQATSIEWTEATWNPVRGCTKVSPGCKYCYAERFAERFRGTKGHPYESGFDLRLAPALPWPPNVWQGVSVEQQQYVRRIDLLREVPSAIRFLSVEPMLGPVE